MFVMWIGQVPPLIKNLNFAKVKKLTLAQKKEFANELEEFKTSNLRTQFRLIVEALVFCGYDCVDFILDSNLCFADKCMSSLQVETIKQKFLSEYAKILIEKIKQ